MMRYGILVFLGILILVFACETPETPNPFDDIQSTQDTVKLPLIAADSNTIAGLYVNIFKPTCANVGCHDGSFEPDFRTLESSYNTLVYQSPIKNDGNFDYRVHPGNAEQSVIMARLDGRITPWMPFQIEPDSDWGEKSERYIAQIRQWINNGAPDISGTMPSIAKPAPRMLGVAAQSENVWIGRDGTTGPMILEEHHDEVALYFSFGHDSENPETFTHNKITFSENPNDFSDPIQLDLEIIDTPVFTRGFHGNVVPYTHRVLLQPKSLFPGTNQIYFRASIKDSQNPITEIPTDDGVFYIKSYMSFIEK